MNYPIKNTTYLHSLPIKTNTKIDFIKKNFKYIVTNDNLGKVISFAVKHLNITKRFPKLKLKKNCLHSGVYLPKNFEINVRRFELGTIFHEYVHAKQFIDDPKNFESKYADSTLRVGYTNNPYEIEAREKSKIMEELFIESLFDFE